MTTQHTPGPWRLGLVTGGDLRPVEDEAYLDMGNEDDGSHCEVEVSGTNAPANARLIASAPELLAELRDLAEKVRSAGEAGCFEGWKPAYKRARAAIAKATGAVESPLAEGTPA